MDEIINCVADKNGLVKGDVGHQFFGDVKHVGNGFFDAIHDGDSVRVASLLEYGHIDGRLTVYAHDVVLDFRSVHRVAHIADDHGRIVDGFQWNFVEVVDVVNLAVDVEI